VSSRANFDTESTESMRTVLIGSKTRCFSATCPKVDCSVENLTCVGKSSDFEFRAVYKLPRSLLLGIYAAVPVLFELLVTSYDFVNKYF
jgi:hypothetical protein